MLKIGDRVTSALPAEALNNPKRASMTGTVEEVFGSHGRLTPVRVRWEDGSIEILEMLYLKVVE